MKKFYLPIWLIAGVCLSLVEASAQELFFREHPLGEELDGVRPQLMYEQAGGYLWLGGEGGLLRYDGQVYRRWLAPDSLGAQVVSSISEDRRGILWVGYDNGSIFRMLEGDRLEPWLIEEGWPSAAITGIVEDEQGSLWIATYGEGLYCYRSGHLYNFDQADGLPGQDIYTIAKDACGRILIGTDGGLSHCSWVGSHKRIHTITKSDGLPDDIIRAILPDEYGRVWVGGYEGGVAQLDDALDCITLGPTWPGGIVRSLAALGGEQLWVGTDGDGLYKLNVAAGHWQKDSLSGRSKVYSLLIDAESNLWAITHTLGLLSAQCRFLFRQTPLANLQTISVDRAGRQWLGDQSGLYVCEPGQQLYRPIKALAGQNIISSYLDHYGFLWLGTFGNGLFGLDIQTGLSRHFCEGEEVQNGSILSLTGLGDTLWMATLGGVYTLTYGPDALGGGLSRCAFFEVEEGIGKDFIYCVFADREHRLWFGLDGKGAASWDGQTMNWYKQAEGGKEIRRVYSIAQDGRGQIWLNTAENGVFHQLGSGQFAPVPHAMGEKKQQVASLIADGAGHILVVHDKGINMWDPYTGHWVFYDASVGIHDFEPSLNAATVDPSGKVWLVGKNKLVCALPLSRIGGREDPKTMLEGVAVFLSPASFWEKTIFAADENNLVFSYTGLWYTDPQSVRYRFRLEGFDLDWIETADRNATYSNLPPGKYTFRVAALVAPQFHPSDAAVYIFQIRSPLWQRTWFVLLLTAALLGGFLLLVRQRENRLRREAGFRKENIESQYETLKSQINPHFLFNSFNTLAGLIEENPQNAVTYVEKLADFYRSILLYREKDLISLAEEIKLIEDYFYLLQERYGSYVQLELKIADRQGLVVPMALQMLVENAIKHNVITRDRPLLIQISDDASAQRLLICNNLQPKLSPERSTGFGLQSIIRRYAILTQQTVGIQSDEKHFCVSLPIIPARASKTSEPWLKRFGSPDTNAL